MSCLAHTMTPRDLISNRPNFAFRITVGCQIDHLCPLRNPLGQHKCFPPNRQPESVHDPGHHRIDLLAGGRRCSLLGTRYDGMYRRSWVYAVDLAIEPGSWHVVSAAADPWTANLGDASTKDWRVSS